MKTLRIPPIVGLLTLLCQSPAVLGDLIYASSYSFEQKGNTDYGVTVEPVPIDLNETESTPISSYTFDVRSVPSTPTELKASAGFQMNIDQRNSETTWSSLKVRATSKSSLTDTAFVEGIDGFTSGTVQITWAVDGISNILLDATGPNGLLVSDLATVALLTSSVPSDVPDLFVNDVADNRFLGNAIIQSNLPDTSGFQTYVVDWIAGQPIDLFFDLEVTTILEVDNLDAAGFTADVSADFSNTASLSSVQILNSMGQPISGASLIMNNGTPFAPTAVPEPSTVCLWGVLAAGMLLRRFLPTLSPFPTR